jgi:hypothetical protein
VPKFSNVRYLVNLSRHSTEPRPEASKGGAYLWLSCLQSVTNGLRKQPCHRSAYRREADEVGVKSDIRSWMSAVGGRADVVNSQKLPFEHSFHSIDFPAYIALRQSRRPSYTTNSKSAASNT